MSLLESPAPPGNLKPINLSVTLPAFGVGEAVEVSFENVDYRLAVSVAGREVLVSSDDPNSPGYYAPDVSALRKCIALASPWLRIYGEQGRFELSHVQVQRDEYYSPKPEPTYCPPCPGPREGWASRQSPMLLRDGEYFMLGDNTAASKDSRLWDVRGKHLIEPPRGVSTRDRPQRSTHRQGLLRLLAQRTTPAVASFRRRLALADRPGRRANALDSIAWPIRPLGHGPSRAVGCPESSRYLTVAVRIKNARSLPLIPKRYARRRLDGPSQRGHSSTP